MLTSKIIKESPMLEATSSEQWFYEEKGERKGEIGTPQIIELIRTGQLIYGSLVWKRGMPDWIQIEKTELRHHLEAFSPPPLTGRRVSNTLAWLLAFAPLIGFMLQCFAAGLTGDSESQWEQAMADSRYWYLTLILNIVFSLLDEKRLKQAGYDTRRFKLWVLILPVYLYKRAKVLNQMQAPCIVWVICFVLTLLTTQSFT
jgi:hypothetical protein